MSTYYIKQNTFTTSDKYFIYNKDKTPILEVISNGLVVFIDRILGSLFSFSRNFRVKNLDGREVFILHKKMGCIWEKYDMVVNGDVLASISQEKTLMIPKILISAKDCNYIVSSNPLAKSFLIKKDETIVAEITKKILSFGDAYELCIYEEGNDELFIATTIAIDNSYYE